MDNVDNFDKMIASASGAIDFIFNPSPKDNVLILTDNFSETIAQSFKHAFENIGCIVDTFKIEDDKRPLKEIPPQLELLLKDKTIALNIIKAFPEEIPFRIKWIFKVEENKNIKMGHMPGITEDMMMRSVNVDFKKMKTDADRLISSLKDAAQINIRTDAGTNVTLGVKERIFSEDIGVKNGEMCNLPCGEVYCAPLETEANGVIVFDASIGDIGLLKHPLKIFVSKGRITKFESADQDLVQTITLLTDVDEDAKVIGELGIGVNPGAKITGNMLEDEKTLGTAHIAFGNNEDFPGGGKNFSKIHRDYLMYNPTITVLFADHSEKVILDKGIIVC